MPNECEQVWRKPSGKHIRSDSHPSFKSSADIEIAVVRQSFSVYPCIRRTRSAYEQTALCTQSPTSYTHKIIMAFICNTLANCPLPRHTSSENHNHRHLPAVPTRTETREYCPRWLLSEEGAGVGGGQMSDHTWSPGIHVCGDKISCLPWQLNGGCIEGYCSGQ